MDYIEISGAILALIYLYLEIKGHFLMWIIGILASIFYLVVFYKSAFYADMGLQLYYIVISIVGWYWWLKGIGKTPEIGLNIGLPITRISLNLGIKLAIIVVLLYIFILFSLLYLPSYLHLTGAALPYLDAFVFSASMLATWMLARKIMEHWIIWVVVNFLSVGMFLFKNLEVTSGLYFIYGIGSIIGYLKWSKQLKESIIAE